MGVNKISLGLVVGLGYRDATLSVHHLLQQVKTHPFFNKIVSGGERIAWGAKTIPEGGYYAVPERLFVPGALIVGDGAGLVNVPALKGIHYAMGSGMIAADTLFAALSEGRDLACAEVGSHYDAAIRQSFIMNDLYRVRNMRQGFDHGFIPGVFLAGLMTLTGGAFPKGPFKTQADRDKPIFIGDKIYPKPDGQTIFDKLSSVHLSGNKTRDDQPSHLHLPTAVSDPMATAWVNMCPANVYEKGVAEAASTVAGGAAPHFLRVNPTNCVQCGAIGATGGQLTPPEGGSGPEYKET